MKGYKGFDKDLKCRDFQYEVGKTYECKGGVVLCENGFHFCEDPKNISVYYADLTTCRYCEVEASGKIINGDGKCVCSKITIVREIPSQEFLSLVNEGSRNSGWSNKGDGNEGNRNKGDRNEGNCNKGDGNKGDWNEGDSNEGDSNEGDRNKGDWNEGDSNEGDSNEGDRNKGDRNEGNCNEGDGNKGNYNKGDGNEGNYNEGNYNIGSYNRGNDLCGLLNTDGGCVIFNKYTPTKHTDIEEMCGFRILVSCMSLGRMPDSAELEEIRKLPNFDEAVMRELILGKESRK
jgi:hypothetical protein